MTAIKEDDNAKNEPMASVAEGVAFDEDEIDLMEYIVLLWRHKYLILAGSILPTLAIGLVLFFGPRDYGLTYTYGNWSIDSKNFELFLEDFYSGENMGRVVSKLQSDGLKDFAMLIENANGRQSLEKLINFEIWSPEMSFASKLGLSKSDLTYEEAGPFLVRMIVTASDQQKEITKIASVVRGTVENVIPLYDVERELVSETNEYRTKMATIEEGRFKLKSSLKAKAAALQMLKEIDVDASSPVNANLTLQFNVGEQSAFLPLTYHIQAAEASIVELKEKTATAEEEHNYYDAIISLNNKLLTEIRNCRSTGKSIQQFQAYLVDLSGSKETEAANGYLDAYIKKLENRILSRVPVADAPKTYYVGRSTVKKSGIAFAVFLMVSVFAAFIWDGIRCRQSRTA